MSLKFVKEIKVMYDPFVSNKATTIAREFFRRVSSPKLLKENPKCKLESTVKCDHSDATIHILFADKQSVTLDASNSNFKEVFSEFKKECQLRES